MRILHTSDWHLGRNFHGVQLLDAQASALEALEQIVRSESIDVVVIAGDIYDRAVPPADAVALLSNTLAAIRAAGARVVGISGNHDSSIRVGFAEEILSMAGVTLRGDMRSAGRPVIVPEASGDGAVAFYPIPYLEPESARHVLDVPDARSHERLLKVALERASADLSKRQNVRSVAIVHAFVTGGQQCDSELALTVGGSAEVPLKHLRGFDYVALGHLHGRQALGAGQARYSGSLLPYSFSERAQVKGAWIVDVPPAASSGSYGSTHIESVDFPLYRSLHQLRGTLEQLLTSSLHRNAESGFVQATLIDPDLPADAMAKLRRRFPHAVLLSHDPPRRLTRERSYAERIQGRGDLELTLDFIEYVSGRKAQPLETRELASVIDSASVEADDVETPLAVA